VSGTARALIRAVKLAPFVVGGAVALYFFNWQGLLAGAVLARMGQLAVRPAIRRIHSRVLHAAWGVYVDPGYTGEIRFGAASGKFPRVIGRDDEQAGSGQARDWLLADGAWMENVEGELHTTLDGRYVGARIYPAGESFLLYDQTQHVRYSYDNDDAEEVFDALFPGAGQAGMAEGQVAALLARAERTKLHPWRGMWLEKDMVPEHSETVLRKVLAPNLVLTATLIGPEDLRIVDDPSELLIDQVRRLSLNGFPTPFFCRDLDHALAAPDGKSLMVKGFVVCDEFSPNGDRWYYRRANGDWATLEAQTYDVASGETGYLQSIVSLGDTEAVFALHTNFGEQSVCWIQAARQPVAFKVPVDRTGATPTCRVPLEKLL
jgi:hypothetical protein